MKVLVLSVMSFFLLISAGTQAQTKYVAHRGASHYAPENTLGSIRLAWELGADGAECDIRLTKDKQIVLSHDGNTQRIADKNLEIAQSTYAELAKLNLKLQPNNSVWFEGEKIPLLKDVLKVMKKGQLLVIEIKCGKEVFPELEKVVKKYWTQGDIAFIAFNFETIGALKTMYPKVQCYYLSSTKKDVLSKIPDIQKLQIDGVDVNSAAIDQEMVDKLRQANIGIWCWTVDKIDEANRMKSLGVNVITTNRPTFLKEQIEN